MAIDIWDLIRERDERLDTERGVFINGQQMPVLKPEWFEVGQTWRLSGYRFWVTDKVRWINRDIDEDQRVYIECQKIPDSIPLWRPGR